MKKLRKKCEGSLYVGISLALVFITVFMGIALQQVLLFSSFVHKKQEYMTSFYMADALIQYGVAHAREHYDSIYESKEEMRLLFDSWPAQDEQAQDKQGKYTGVIVIKKGESALTVEAELAEQGRTIQRHACAIAKTADQQFHVTEWQKL